MANDRPRRKRIRLPHDAYAVPDTAWLVSIAVHDRPASPFANSTLAQSILDMLVDRCVGRLELFAVVVMPDHVHLLVAIPSGNLIDHVAALKSATTHLWWEHGGVGKLWQRSYHDRGLRDDAIFEKAVEYILNNPVEAGLATSWADYPYIAGSLIGQRS